MENDRRTLAQQNDPVLAGVIVKDALEIETRFRLLAGPLSDRLLRDVSATMRKAAPKPWEVVESDFTLVLSHSDFRSPNGLGRGDLWLEISELATDEEDHSWIAAAVGAGPTKMGLELNFRKGLQLAADNVTREKTQEARLKEIGFRRDDTGKRLYMPIEIDRLRLSKGFSESDLTEALTPVRKATEAIVSAKADLDKLIETVRQNSKGK